MTHILIPVKPFGIAKARLGPVLDAPSRSRLGRAIAAHTIAQARSVSPLVSVVTPDREVARWADGLDCGVILESEPAGLDKAASAAVDLVTGPWLILFADIPLVTPEDIEACTGPISAGRSIIAPSHDGGTTAIGGHQAVLFAFGQGSFRRHLSMLGSQAVVITKVGLAIDLDDAHDLFVIRRHPAGAWINNHVSDSGAAESVRSGSPSLHP